MTRDVYARALDEAVAEWNALTAERQALDRRIAQLAQTIGSLNKLCGYESNVPLGLTDACRMVLRNAGHPLTVGEVRLQLHAMGVDLDRYVNALAAIHTVLKRLRESGEVRLVPGYGKPAYEWAHVATIVLEPSALRTIDHGAAVADSRRGRPKRRPNVEDE